MDPARTPIWKYVNILNSKDTDAKAADWNFNKYLIDKRGYPVKHFASAFDLVSLEADIEAQLGKDNAGASLNTQRLSNVGGLGQLNAESRSTKFPTSVTGVGHSLRHPAGIGPRISESGTAQEHPEKYGGSQAHISGIPEFPEYNCCILPEIWGNTLRNTVGLANSGCHTDKWGHGVVHIATLTCLLGGRHGDVARHGYRAALPQYSISADAQTLGLPNRCPGLRTADSALKCESQLI